MQMTETSTIETVTASEQGTKAAPEKAAGRKDATKKKSTTSKNAAKVGKHKAPAPAAKTSPTSTTTKKNPKPGKAARAETRGAKLLAMVGRAKGATLAELMAELGWQAHSVRGFISIAAKKGTNIDSSRNDAGERVYKIT